jgi:hypothetical protein
MLWRGSTLLLCIAVAACAGSRSPYHGVEDTGVEGGLIFSDAAVSEGGSKLDQGAQPDSAQACGPNTCLGCCLATGVCAPGSNDGQCGKSGAACTDCAASGKTCKQGVCTSCAGCISGGTCYSGTSKSKCGSGGAACTSCSSSNPCKTTTCSGGACKSADVSNGTSCPGGKCYSGACCTGCWNGTACLNGTSTSNCGDNGAACTSCSTWYKCNGACYCGPSSSFQLVGGVCRPSCGAYINANKWPNPTGLGCCQTGCKYIGSTLGETYDCPYCCRTDGPGPCN